MGCTKQPTCAYEPVKFIENIDLTLPFRDIIIRLDNRMAATYIIVSAIKLINCEVGVLKIEVG